MDTNSRQAGIEITEEMIAAGTDELAAYDREIDDGQLFVVRLFEAMERARIPPKPKPGVAVAPDGSMDTPGVPRDC